MTKTAYITVSRIDADRNGTSFVSGFAGDTDELTATAFQDVRKKFETSFEEADYLVDLYASQDELIETFPMTNRGYLQLTGIAGPM